MPQRQCRFERCRTGIILSCTLIVLMSNPTTATECVGHRGNSGEQLENSYSALESAYAIGVPNIEFDIHHSRDGVAILSHDDKLRRVATDKPGKHCDVRAKIDELTAQDILENCQMKNGDEVAVLEAVFDRFQGRAVRLFLELKDVPNERTLELLRQHYGERTDSIRIISKNVEALNVARDRLGRAFRHFHIHRHFKRSSVEFDGILNRNANARRVGGITTDEFSTGTYTINSAEDMLEYRDAGLSYVISDNPRVCMQTLARD